MGGRYAELMTMSSTNQNAGILQLHRARPASKAEASKALVATARNDSP